MGGDNQPHRGGRAQMLESSEPRLIETIHGEGKNFSIRRRNSHRTAGPEINEPTRNGWGGRNNTNPLQNINANDIDHVEVVKGAAATTLYGTEASGGVIQIFTKRGMSGTPSWDLDVTQGFNASNHWGDPNDPTNLWVDCNNTDLMYGLNLSTGAKRPFTDPTCPADGNWTVHGQIQRYGVSVRGGSDNVKYFVSGNYDQNAGMLPTQMAPLGYFVARVVSSCAQKQMRRINAGPHVATMEDTQMRREERVVC